MFSVLFLLLLICFVFYHYIYIFLNAFMFVVKIFQLFCWDSRQWLTLHINKWKTVIITTDLDIIFRMLITTFHKVSGNALTGKINHTFGIGLDNVYPWVLCNFKLPKIQDLTFLHMLACSKLIFWDTFTHIFI